jgi:hypothetical protein
MIKRFMILLTIFLLLTTAALASSFDVRNCSDFNVLVIAKLDGPPTEKESYTFIKGYEVYPKDSKTWVLEVGADYYIGSVNMITKKIEEQVVIEGVKDFKDIKPMHFYCED